MTIKSIPPASSHLADRPVPAPPPTIGSPRATLARRRARMPSRELSAVVVAVTAGPFSSRSAGVPPAVCTKNAGGTPALRSAQRELCFIETVSHTRRYVLERPHQRLGKRRVINVVRQ